MRCCRSASVEMESNENYKPPSTNKKNLIAHSNIIIKELPTYMNFFLIVKGLIKLSAEFLSFNKIYFFRGITHVEIKKLPESLRSACPAPSVRAASPSTFPVQGFRCYRWGSDRRYSSWPRSW